jgi:hypothetical protein
MTRRDALIREAIRIETGVDIGPGSILKRRREVIDAALQRHVNERHDDGDLVPTCPICPPADGGCVG